MLVGHEDVKGEDWCGAAPRLGGAYRIRWREQGGVPDETARSIARLAGVSPVEKSNSWMTASLSEETGKTVVGLATLRSTRTTVPTATVMVRPLSAPVSTRLGAGSSAFSTADGDNPSCGGLA